MQPARTAAQTARDAPGGQGALTDVGDDPAGLEADEQEDGVLEDEGDGPPVHPFGDPRLRGLHDRRLVPEQQAGDDDRDDPGGVDLLGGDEGHEGDDERDRGVQHRVGDQLAQLGDDDEDDEADGGSPQRRDEELLPDVEGLHSDGHRGDGGTQRDEGGGVVEQRLALEDRHDPAGQPYSPGDRGGRDGVRGRDDRADGEGHGPGDVGDQGVHDDAHAQGREHHQADRQQQDRAAVGVEVDERGLDRRGVQQRRQQPEQHHVGLEVDLRDPRDVRARDPDRDQQQRRREVDAVGQGGERQHRDGHGHEQDRDLHGAYCVRACEDPIRLRFPARFPAGRRRRIGGGVRRARRPSASGRPTRAPRRRACRTRARRACAGGRRR